MLTSDDLHLIEDVFGKYFEEKMMPALMRVFIQKDDLKKAFDQHDRKMDVRFGRLEKRMDHMEETMDQRFAQVDERFAQMDQRFAQVDERFAQIDQRFDDANDRMQEIRSTLDSVHLKLDQHIEDTSSKLSAHLRRIHELQGISVSDKPKVGYTILTAKLKSKPKPKKV